MLMKCISYRAECEAEVLKFTGAKYRKFNTDVEAINFVNEHKKSDILSKTQQTHMKGCGENITLKHLSTQRTDTQDITLSQPGTSEFTNMSSPKLKGRALKQRLSLLEKMYEDSMKELRAEIDRIKESVETFNTSVNIPSNSNAHDPATVTEEYKALQERLSQFTKHFRNTVTELKAEINSLKLAVNNVGLEAGQNKAQSKEGAYVASSSLPCKSNHSLILDADGPSTTSARYVQVETV
jgi:viroplasmin and RNaseH domain-containing protein